MQARTGNVVTVGVLKVMPRGVHNGHRNGLLKTASKSYNFRSRELPGPAGVLGADYLEAKKFGLRVEQLVGVAAHLSKKHISYELGFHAN